MFITFFHFKKKLQMLRIAMHSDKTFIRKVKKGFDFPRLHLTPVDMMVPDTSLSRHEQKTLRLSEQSQCRFSNALLALFLAGSLCSFPVAADVLPSGETHSVGAVPEELINNKLLSGQAAIPAEKQLKSSGAMANPVGFSIIDGSNFFTYVDVTTPETLNNLFSYTPPSFANAADFGADPNIAYGLWHNGQAVKINLSTMIVTNLGTITTNGSVTGMSYDPQSGQFYVSTTSCGNRSTLYTVNFDNLTATQVGRVTGASCLISLAVDSQGDLYGHDIIDDGLHKIDKATGGGTRVGNLGFNANYGQGMGFDYKSNTMYMTAFNFNTSRGELRTVNLSTGATTLIGVLGSTTPDPGGSSQLGFLAFAPITTNIPAYGPFAFAISLMGLLWFGRRQKRR